jgi:iron complex outermembrane receptor protein
LRATRYGEALDPDQRLAGTAAQPIGAQDGPLGAETIVDIEGRFALGERIRFALGAENVFDEYPEPFPLVRNSTGNTPYSNYSAFGRSGRFIYGRVTFDF